MAQSHTSEIQFLKNRIRDFEDRKISGADLSRDVYFVAREIFDPDEANLRRALEKIGNRIAVLSERGGGHYAEILTMVDEIQAELVDTGY